MGVDVSRNTKNSSVMYSTQDERLPCALSNTHLIPGKRQPENLPPVLQCTLTDKAKQERSRAPRMISAFISKSTLHSSYGMGS